MQKFTATEEALLRDLHRLTGALRRSPDEVIRTTAIDIHRRTGQSLAQSAASPVSNSVPRES